MILVSVIFSDVGLRSLVIAPGATFAMQGQSTWSTNLLRPMSEKDASQYLRDLEAFHLEQDRRQCERMGVPKASSAIVMACQFPLTDEGLGAKAFVLDSLTSL